MATKRTTPTKRKAAAPKTAAKKPNAKKANAVKSTAVRPSAIQPRPLEDDEIELSGVFGVVRYKESDPLAEVREIFDHYDRDKDGVISAREFARVLEGLGMELEEHELKLAVGEVDRDGNETIEWAEFLSWWRSMRG